MRERFNNAREILGLDTMTKELLEHSEKSINALRDYLKGVNDIFGHMGNVVDTAVADADRVHLRTLNQKFGLPDGTIALGKNVYPTIPSDFPGTCNKGKNYLHKLPIDVQSMLVACVMVSHRGTAQRIPPPHGRALNAGVQFGELGFKGLPSYRTL